MTERNWAGNVEFGATAVAEPATVAELQDTVVAAATSGRRVHAAGTRHSFSRVADTDGVLVSTRRLTGETAIDPESRAVTLGAGTRYGDLAAVLHDAGWALQNLPSLPHITVGGAVATGTHGSGDRHRNLSSAVTAVELVAADGEMIRFDRDDERFGGAVVNLGALGVMSAVTLAIEPTYDVVQQVFGPLPFDVVVDELDAVMATTDSVSLFTTWASDEFHQVWCKSRLGGAAAPVGSVGDLAPLTTTVHMVEGVSAAACTEQLGRPGAWHDRMPHFRLGFTPSVGAELQTEYFVARSDGPDALRAVRELGELIEPLLLVTEIRSVASDDLWLSPAYGRDSVALHFTWRPDQPRVEALLPEIEEVLAPFAARPHWGKLTTMSAGAIREAYERFDDFAALVGALDPAGVFRNDYLDRHLTDR